MSQSTKIYAGIIVLAALSGAIYVAQKKDKEIGTSHTTSAELPEIKAPDDVDKVSITNGDKGEIVLEKEGDKWAVAKPVNAPANQSNVDQLVKNLKELKAKEVIVAQPSEESKTDYEFIPSKAVHVIAYKGGDKKLDVTFGSSGQRGQMIMVDGKPGIYAVTGYSSYLYTREVKGFRDTEIFKFDDQNVSGFTIEKKDAVLSFTKEGDKWHGTNKGKAIDRLDEEKIKDALRTFKSLTADDFGDDKSLAETGLDKPESTVAIQLKDNAGRFVLKVGKIATGTNRWAMKDGSETVYSIASYAADWALAEPSKFQRPLDAGAPTDAGNAAMPSFDPHNPPH
jgi:hypothetical protein